MASITMVPAVAPMGGRVFAATGGAKKEKSVLDWILGGMMKEDQLLETDPVLKKVEEEKKATTSGRKGTAAPPPKKKGGFGGLFIKN